MGKYCDIAVIGAGPYGLSLAAHLAAAPVSLRIFGKPLSTWRSHMPRGMHLKSDAAAASLSAPDANATFKAWRAAQAAAPGATDDGNQPVSLTAFNDYAAWFQKTYVPGLDVRQVTALAAMDPGYALTLDNGERIEAGRVVLAVGLTHFAAMPAMLAELPPHLVSHSYDHRDLSQFAGRHVLVLGAGASAIDIAVLASEAGAHVSLLARAPRIPYEQQSASGGRGVAAAPGLFRHLPKAWRLRALRRHCGPGWFMKGRLEGRALEFLGYRIESARVIEGRVQVAAAGRDGQPLSLTADHVIAATGYRPDLRRLPFLDSGMLEAIRKTGAMPRLSADFETSLRGLYVTGALAENSFGPLMRLVAGAGYAAPRLAAHLARKAAKKPGTSPLRPVPLPRPGLSGG